MHPKLQGGRLSGGWGVEMRYGISSKVFLFQILNSATSRTHVHNHTQTSSESSCSHLSSFVFVWGESIRSVGAAKLSTSLGILAHLLRVVMEPKYYAFGMWLYTCKSQSSSDVIGSLGLVFFWDRGGATCNVSRRVRRFEVRFFKIDTTCWCFPKGKRNDSLCLLGGGFKYFFSFIPTWGNAPIWLFFVWNGLKPPTSLLCFSSKM